MPKIIPASIKLEAMKLFLGGDKTAREIAEEVSTVEIQVKPVTIYAWDTRILVVSQNKVEKPATNRGRLVLLCEKLFPFGLLE